MNVIFTEKKSDSVEVPLSPQSKEWIKVWQKRFKIHISLERHLFTKELLLPHAYLGSWNSYPFLLSILDCFQLAATNVEGSSFSWW